MVIFHSYGLVYWRIVLVCLSEAVSAIVDAL